MKQSALQFDLFSSSPEAPVPKELTQSKTVPHVEVTVAIAPVAQAALAYQGKVTEKQQKYLAAKIYDLTGKRIPSRSFECTKDEASELIDFISVGPLEIRKNRAGKIVQLMSLVGKNFFIHGDVHTVLCAVRRDQHFTLRTYRNMTAVDYVFPRECRVELYEVD